MGDGSDVTVIAGCGVHNPGGGKAQYDGIQEFFVGRDARMKYVETHFGGDSGSGESIVNPTAIIEVGENATAELELIRLNGAESSWSDTHVKLHKNARLIIVERLLTRHTQFAESGITVELLEEDAAAEIVIRAAARNNSKQVFRLGLRGSARCRGDIQCRTLIMDDAQIAAMPELTALHAEAQLHHEAAVSGPGRENTETILKGFFA